MLLVGLHFISGIADPAVVTTKEGPVRGIVTPTARFWRGIPFAAPPVGNLRWQSPAPHTPWQPAIKDATHFGHNCLQSGTTFDMGWPQPRSSLSEDCLTLNVYAGPTGSKPGAPVLFWIFGGGFQGGGGNETRLNGTWDAALMRGDLVVVTSNYRLGTFGFAASTALSRRETAIAGENRGAGNYGILDQRAALQWVHANIASFGGDPARVLIVGQSAGASSVSQHLVRPKSWGLFAAAGMESGAFYDGFNTPTLASSEATWQKFIKANGCQHAPDPAECLVALPADAILNVTVQGWGGGWEGPVIDGVDLTAPGPELAQAGKLAPVDVFAGGVEEDIDIWGSPCVTSTCTRDDFVTAATTFGMDLHDAQRLATLYASDAPRPGQTAAQLWHYAIMHAGADAWANCPARRLARWYASLMKRRSYWYKWSYVPSGPNGGGLSHHSVEQPFIFHVLSETVEEAKEDGGKYRIHGEDEVALSATLVHLWAAMAAKGDSNTPGPHGVNTPGLHGVNTPGVHGVRWPLFNSSLNGSALLIEGGRGAPPSLRGANDFQSAKCDIFDGVFFARREMTGGQRGFASPSALYERVPGWPIGLPSGARGISAVAVDHTTPGKEVYVSQRGSGYPQPILVFSGAGALLRSFGADKISHINGTWGSHGINIEVDPVTGAELWVYDISVGAVLVFDRFGKLLDTGGHGGHGSGVAPMQYGNVADGSFSKDMSIAYVADGDGGVNNRIVALNTTFGLADPAGLLWIAGNAEGSPHGVGDPGFRSPHAVAVHSPTGNLVVADRENNRTVLLTSAGKYLGEWRCPQLGQRGRAWGVRTWASPVADLVFVATADSPEDGKHQYLHVLDGSGITPHAAGPCRVLQTLTLDTALCVTPHELGVDADNGDVYLGCVTQNATQGSVAGLLKFSFRAAAV